MSFSEDFRKERSQLGVSLDLLAALIGSISNASLSRIERGLQEASPEAQRLILTALNSLQHLRMKFDQIPLSKCDVVWIRRQIQSLNDGRDADSVRKNGPALKAKRARASASAK